MGWAARLNPRSLSGGKAPTEVYHALLSRFAEFSKSRAEFDAYCESANLTESERAYLAQFLPPALRES